MEKKAQECIKILTELEPVFKRAGQTALNFRKTAKSIQKYNTGVAGIDIVTEADLKVLEEILAEIIKTKLVECKIYAEENTGLVKKFKGTNGLTLTLDPIDGTLFYASTGKFYSVIVCLNDGKNPLYTFCHYPELNWTRKITKNGVEDFGDLPTIDNLDESINPSKVIIHTGKDPEKIGPEVYNKLIQQGYVFRKVAEVTKDEGSTALFFLNLVGGYYNSNPNPYDGLTVLHYGQAKKFKIYSDIDISNVIVGDHGPHCQGWYVVLQK